MIERLLFSKFSDIFRREPRVRTDTRVRDAIIQQIVRYYKVFLSLACEDAFHPAFHVGYAVDVLLP